MTLLLILVGLSIVSTILVIAAGMLSSRMSREERYLEQYEEADMLPTEHTAETAD